MALWPEGQMAECTVCAPARAHLVNAHDSVRLPTGRRLVLRLAKAPTLTAASILMMMCKITCSDMRLVSSAVPRDGRPSLGAGGK